MKKTVLVAGGAGFIGSNLCKRLLDDGHVVICLDNLSSGTRSNLAESARHPGFRFIEHDVIDPLVDLDLPPLEEVYNLACPASPPFYQKDPIQTLKTCFMGALNLLNLALDNSATYLQASTSEVYGDPEVHPQPEGYWGNVNPIGVRSCYDEGKRAAETLCFDFRRTHGLDVRVVRIFNTYGPNMDRFDGRVVSNFINQAIRDEPLTVYGDGSQTRSFCYIDDLVEGVVLTMAVQEIGDGPINLGNPAEFSMLELAEIVLQKTGSSSSLSFQDLPQDDPKQRRPDITEATKQLGWEPVTSLDLGLEKTVSYYQSLSLRKAS